MARILSLSGKAYWSAAERVLRSGVPVLCDTWSAWIGSKRPMGSLKIGQGKSAKAPLISSSLRILLPWLGSSRLVVLGRGGVRPEERSTGFVRPLAGPDQLKTAYGKPQNRQGV